MQQDFNINYPNNATLSASVYLMWAYHQKGDLERSKTHIEFLQNHHLELDIDSRILLERNSSKIPQTAGLFTAT